MKTEIVFVVEDDPDRATTPARGESIFTQADSVEALRAAIRDAVRCHFAEEALRPKVIRIHWVRDEVIAA